MNTLHVALTKRPVLFVNKKDTVVKVVANRYFKHNDHSKVSARFILHGSARYFQLL